MLAKLAVHEKRQASVDVGVDVVVRIFSLQQFHRSVGFVLRQRDVRHADIEPVLRLEFEITQIEFSAAVLV